jgi:hypothetical protein
MRREAGFGVWTWNVVTPESSIVWEDQQLESKTVTGVAMDGNVPGAPCRGSLLMSQGYPQPGNPLRARGSFWQGCDLAVGRREMDRSL